MLALQVTVHSPLAFWNFTLHFSVCIDQHLRNSVTETEMSVLSVAASCAAGDSLLTPASWPDGRPRGHLKSQSLGGWTRGKLVERGGKTALVNSVNIIVSIGTTI